MPAPLFFLPPDFLVFLPEEPLATFLTSFSSPATLTSHSPFPTGGRLLRLYPGKPAPKPSETTLAFVRTGEIRAERSFPRTRMVMLAKGWSPEHRRVMR